VPVHLARLEIGRAVDLDLEERFAKPLRGAATADLVK
jgi:hypothetical protein